MHTIAIAPVSSTDVYLEAEKALGLMQKMTQPDVPYPLISSFSMSSNPSSHTDAMRRQS